LLFVQFFVFVFSSRAARDEGTGLSLDDGAAAQGKAQNSGPRGQARTRYAHTRIAIGFRGRRAAWANQLTYKRPRSAGDWTNLPCNFGIDRWTLSDWPAGDGRASIRRAAGREASPLSHFLCARSAHLLAFAAPLVLPGSSTDLTSASTSPFAHLHVRSASLVDWFWGMLCPIRPVCQRVCPRGEIFFALPARPLPPFCLRQMRLRSTPLPPLGLRACHSAVPLPGVTGRARGGSWPPPD
jgi:hypothetical protein